MKLKRHGYLHVEKEQKCGQCGGVFGNKIKLMSHKRIHFGREKEKLFKRADLFILPTKTENFGITILEAMTYKVPVITTKNAPWKIIKDNSKYFQILINMP